MLPRRSPSQRLASLALGRDVVTWLRERRPHLESGTSFRTLARELHNLTGGQVDVTDQTVRNWWGEPGDGEAAEAS